MKNLKFVNGKGHKDSLKYTWFLLCWAWERHHWVNPATKCVRVRASKWVLLWKRPLYWVLHRAVFSFDVPVLWSPINSRVSDLTFNNNEQYVCFSSQQNLEIDGMFCEKTNALKWYTIEIDMILQKRSLNHFEVWLTHSSQCIYLLT